MKNMGNFLSVFPIQTKFKSKISISFCNFRIPELSFHQSAGVLSDFNVLSHYESVISGCQNP